MQELFDFILVHLYYRLFVRPRPVVKAALEWDIDLPGMKAFYKGSKQIQEQNPLAGMSMSFYLAGDGEGGKALCGALNPIPAVAQAALDTMPPKHSNRLLRRLIEEGDRVFRSAWGRSTINFLSNEDTQELAPGFFIERPGRGLRLGGGLAPSFFQGCFGVLMKVLFFFLISATLILPNRSIEY